MGYKMAILPQICKKYGIYAIIQVVKFNCVGNFYCHSEFISEPRQKNERLRHPRSG